MRKCGQNMNVMFYTLQHSGFVVGENTNDGGKTLKL